MKNHYEDPVTNIAGPVDVEELIASPGSANTFPSDINNVFGEDVIFISGFSFVGNRQRAEFWTKPLRSGVPVGHVDGADLDQLARATFSNVASSAALGISKNLSPPDSHAIVVGNVRAVQIVDGVPQSSAILPVQWERERTIALPGLDILPAFAGFASANDVNDRGQTVGSVITLNGISAAQWIINPPGSEPLPVVVLGTLSRTGGRSEALAVNNLTQIAGWATRESGRRHAFLWSRGGSDGPAFNPEMRDLDPQELFGETVATDLNVDGAVVGNVLHDSGLSRGFIWTANTGITLLPVDATGEEFGSTADAISEGGLIVGQSGARATLWLGPPGRSSVSPPIDLNNLLRPDSGWHLHRATGVNRQGHIVGAGVLSRPSMHPAGWLIVGLEGQV